MANPQQPEQRRSEQVPALNPDAQEAELEAGRRNTSTVALSCGTERSIGR